MDKMKFFDIFCISCKSFTPLENFRGYKGISLTGHIRKRFSNVAGFTLIEIIIVIIIIGILASLALPRYQQNVEDSRMVEAMTVLKVIHSAQIRYAQEYDQYTEENLDVVIPEEGKFFDFTLLYNNPSPCATATDDELLAQAIRKALPRVPAGCAPSYAIDVYESGTLLTNYTCGGGGGGGGGGCFLAGILITMADGTQKPIEEIQAGDIVLAFNENTGQTEPDTVTKTFSNLKEDVYLVINCTLKVTPLHPVLSKDKWVKIKDLKIGDTLTNTQGKDVAIFDIREVKEWVEVYNFQTNPLHTYIANGFIVHNKPIGRYSI